MILKRLLFIATAIAVVAADAPAKAPKMTKEQEKVFDDVTVTLKKRRCREGKSDILLEQDSRENAQPGFQDENRRWARAEADLRRHRFDMLSKPDKGLYQDLARL